MNFFNEMETLRRNNLLPGELYFSSKRFLKPYNTLSDLAYNAIWPELMPLLNLLEACSYALKGIWSLLNAVGGLLILKPKLAFNAIVDLSYSLTLSIALSLMAPMHLLTYTVELITRIISSWFREKEDESTLRPYHFNRELQDWMVHYAQYFPTYVLNNEPFLTPYVNVTEFIETAGRPVIGFIAGETLSLCYALAFIRFSLQSIAYLAIGQPKHAQEACSNMGISFSISIALAVLTPITNFIREINFLSRLGATWYAATVETEESILTFGNHV